MASWWTDLPNFSESEFKCRCGCGRVDMNRFFMQKLQDVRTITQEPIIISSGYRCHEHNNAVGGEPNGAHTKGLAADIEVTGSRMRYKLLKDLIKIGFHRIGIGKDFIHVDSDDSRDQRVVWTYYPK